MSDHGLPVFPDPLRLQVHLHGGGAQGWKFGTAVRITDALNDRLDQIKKVSAKKFDYTVNWVLPGFWDMTSFKLSQLGPPALQPWDVIVYFVPTRERSLVHKVTKYFPQGDAAGATSPTPKGVITEAYLEGNFPGEKLGNIAMHELMHLKLDLGQKVDGVTDIHELDPQGGGISSKKGVQASTTFTPKEASLMAAHLFDPVEVYKDGN